MYPVAYLSWRPNASSKKIHRLFSAVLGAVCSGFGAADGVNRRANQSCGNRGARAREAAQSETGDDVADVGAGFGAWTVRLARVVGPSGHVFATDIGAAQLAALRDYTTREGLTNVTVLEGAADSTNLPASCCDAILIRDAFHHLTQPEKILASLAAALKPGGRLAVIDFPPRPNSEVPAGVPANRAGHGVRRRTWSSAKAVRC